MSPWMFALPRPAVFLKGKASEWSVQARDHALCALGYHARDPAGRRKGGEDEAEAPAGLLRVAVSTP